jgi:ferredoxin/flavodoxin---NADP+ reductase
MTERGNLDDPIRVAIVGSGPSGFYAADPLLKSESPICAIDMFDRLPTPFGLVRGGVAPDHPKIRKVTKVYEKIAGRERFRFFGNVTIGSDITLPELRQYYDAILFASGAETDRRLNIPGEDLQGSYTATSFVGWYNGHPDFRDHQFDLSQEVAVVIGVGNVAMDVARILTKTPDELRTTDIAEHALDALAESRVREIHVVGRRGAAQAAFTPLELKEMTHLKACQPVANPVDLDLGPLCQEELSDRNRSRNIELLQEIVALPERDTPRKMHFHFLRSPVDIKGNGHVECIVMEKNRLVGTEPFQQWPERTGEKLDLPCGLVFRSIGYRGIPIPGVPFDDKKGIIPNSEGRVTKDGDSVPGLYVAGWAKRGPSGIIGTNKPDSHETADKVLEDASSLPPCSKRDDNAIVAFLDSKGVQWVSFAGWKKIDEAELARGEAVGKPRERFTRIEEMLRIAGVDG